MSQITDRKGYLERISKPLQEKLKVARYIPEDARTVLDVGCADGTVTRVLAHMLPRVTFLGIDLDHGFIEEANHRAEEEGLTNVRFERVYLRDLLARPERFDTVLFVSVLHEFFTYGEGISSVLKALADAHELLHPEGKIVIRDMILDEYSKHTSFRVDTILQKVRGGSPKKIAELLEDFENRFGPIASVYQLNHFLLKYMYEDNWERERTEHYVPVTFDQYQQIFALLGMELQDMEVYLLPYLRDKWQEDFGLAEEELVTLKSVRFLAAKKC